MFNIKKSSVTLASLFIMLASPSYALENRNLRARPNLNSAACRYVTISCYNRYDNRFDLGTTHRVRRQICPPQQAPRGATTECTQQEMNTAYPR